MLSRSPSPSSRSGPGLIPPWWPWSWDQGCEAIVHATTVSGYPLAYFDTAYLHPRNDWAPGDQAEVELAAFVITLAPVPAGVLGPFDPRSVPAVRACQTGTAPGDAAAQDGEPLDGGKANFLLPSTGARANPDEFVFQGPVLSVDVTEAWGQLLYRLEVTVMAVMRAGVLEPFTLPLYVGKHRLKGAPPKAGDRIRGLLWLQGRRAFRSPECDRH